MAISFLNNTGNLFNCIGSLGNLLYTLKTYQTDQQAAAIGYPVGVTAQYAANPDIQAIMGANYIGILDAAGSNIGGTLSQMATQTVNRFVFDDAPRLNQTLTSDATLASLQEIIRQMTQQGATVLFQDVTATATPFVGVGNGVLCVSVRRPSDGRVCENAFAESINVICSQDSYTGGATAGQESFNVTGTGSESNYFAFDWPLGSNASTQIQMISGGDSSGGSNLLTNSSFVTWTSNVPDDWTVVKGEGGVTIFEAAGAGYGTGSALLFVSDGTTLITVEQVLNDPSASLSTLSLLSQYGACVFMRSGGTPATTGTLRISLVDQNGTVLLDEGNNSNSIDVACTDITTEWTAVVVPFRTARDLSYAYFEIGYVDAPDSGFQLYLDRCSLGLMTQIYSGGPWVSGHSGNANFVVNDQSQIVVTNARGGAGELATFQTLWFRLIPQMGQNDLLLPSSVTPSISDTLITSP